MAERAIEHDDRGRDREGGREDGGEDDGEDDSEDDGEDDGLGEVLACALFGAVRPARVQPFGMGSRYGLPLSNGTFLGTCGLYLSQSIFR